MASGFKTTGNQIGEFDRYFMTTTDLIDRYVGGKVWVGGYDEWGWLGDGTATVATAPLNNLFLGNKTATWKKIAKPGNSTTAAAIKSDNTLWLWGLNRNGELGQNTTDNGTFIAHPSPVQIISGGAWKDVAQGSEDSSGGGGFGGYFLGIKTDGTLWAWGLNGAGQLGIGSITPKSSPVQVGADNTWKTITGGYATALGIKTDGTLWAWGYNSSGQLGLGDITNRSSPVQVGADTNWKQVSSGGGPQSAGVKTDGTLWTWGRGALGGLGTLNENDKSSPVQTVAGGTNWKQVTVSHYSMAAIKKDGTLWTWGYNSSGQLGVGDTTSRSSPIQVGSGYDWKTVEGGISFTEGRFTGVKTDGSLWMWGKNAGLYGVGDAVTTPRSSPIQVNPGTLGWVQAAPSASGIIGLNIS